MEDYIVNFKICPNCQDRGLEHLETHSHCVLCNHSLVFSEPEDSDNLVWAVHYLQNLDGKGSNTASEIIDPPALKKAVGQ